MKRSSPRPLALQLQSGTPRVADATKHVARDKGMSRWRALEREQFRALIASPSSQGKPEGGSKSW
jgi:hypothetical protein